MGSVSRQGFARLTLTSLGCGLAFACSSDPPGPKRTGAFVTEAGLRPCRRDADAAPDSGPKAPIDAGADIGPQDAGVPDAEVPLDAGTSVEEDCDDAGAAVEKVLGEINVVSGERTPGSAGTSFRRVEAAFVDAKRRDCATFTYGTCEAVVCSNEVDAGPASFSASVPNVGRVEINASGGSEVLLPLANGTYPTIDKNANPFWGSGGSGEVRFVAQGSASGPSFDAKVTTPPALSIVAPAIPATGPMVINRSAPLPLAWDKVAFGATVELVVRSQDDRVRVRCEFPTGPAQTAQVSSQALLRLPSGSANVTVYSKNETTLDRSDSTVVLSAKSPAAQGTKAFAVTATLQ